MKKLVLTSIAVATIATSAQAYRGNSSDCYSNYTTRTTAATSTNATSAQAYRGNSSDCYSNYTTRTTAATSTNATSAQAYRGNSSDCYSNCTTQSTTATLTQEQKDALIFMYQEEKVARDVYLTLNDKWGARVFENISKSEQKHMDAVKSLLIKYNIEVPVLDDTIGVFENEELQALYDQLVEKGLISLNDACEVGVTVEETDIADLEERMENATSDMQSVFSNLLRGSNNHLKAFNRQLDSSSNDSINCSDNQKNSGYKSHRGNGKGEHRGFSHKGGRWGR